MLDNSQRVRVAIVGSGGGTNARALCQYAQGDSVHYVVALIVSTKPGIGIVDVASDYGVPCCICGSKETFDKDLEAALREHSIDVVLLAGLMRQVSRDTIAAVKGNMLNIHPSLLPKHGGTGMYGIRVHRAVLEAGEKTTGATVHVVTDEYDQGRILAQQETDVHPGDTDALLQERVKAIEHVIYPQVVDKFCASLDLPSKTLEHGVKWAF